MRLLNEVNAFIRAMSTRSAEITMEEMGYKMLGRTVSGYPKSDLAPRLSATNTAEPTRVRCDGPSTTHWTTGSTASMSRPTRPYARGDPTWRNLESRRHEVILATKCARYDFDGFDFSAAGVRRMVDESLQRLRTDYLTSFTSTMLSSAASGRSSRKPSQPCARFSSKERRDLSE